MVNSKIGIHLQDVDEIVADAVFDYFEFGPLNKIFEDYKIAATYFFEYMFRSDYDLLRMAIADVNGVYATQGIEAILGLTFDEKEERKRNDFLKVVKRYVSPMIVRKILEACEQEKNDSLTDLTECYEAVWSNFPRADEPDF